MGPPAGPADRVRSALGADPRLATLVRRLHVEEREGTIVITGRVNELSQKRLVSTVAERALGRPVRNAVHVDSRPRRSDADVMRHVRNAIEEDPWLATYLHEIDVAVQNGVVTLSGRVPSLLRRRLIEATVWWVPGVRDVVNELKVQPPEDDSPEYLADAVNTVLEKDVLVDEQEVAVHVTANGVVTLTGLVKTPEERQAAEHDVWAVPGVLDVVNRLDVVPPGEPIREYPEYGALYHGS